MRTKCRRTFQDAAAAEARGLQRLYVALTRAVSRLTVLHTEPLPAPLPG